MRANLELTRGAIVAEELMMRLGRELGHETAHQVVAGAAQESARSGKRLDEIAIGEAPLELVDAADYVGWSAAPPSRLRCASVRILRPPVTLRRRL